MGRTRDLLRDIKEMTGSYSARCGAMKLSTGKVVTEENEVKEIWQQYTEELYRRGPNVTDSFNETIQKIMVYSFISYCNKRFMRRAVTMFILCH